MGKGPNRVRVRAFEAFLRRFGVAGVLPTQQILRTASAWRTCGTPFEVPPPGTWGRIVPSLRFIRDQVRPRVGPVEAVSGYRNPRLNHCAAGAPQSAHLGFWGVDLVPTTRITRRQLFSRLCALHASATGRSAGFGLGFYTGTRFHVDTKSWRLWGSNNRSGTSPCR
nr:D-Ala-D-Ala carboxypeptidase family metallohydrolase [Sphingomonas sp. ID1715]